MDSESRRRRTALRPVGNDRVSEISCGASRSGQGHQEVSPAHDPMNPLWKFTFQTAAVCVLCISPANGQARPDAKPPMAEEVFKNVQVLKGISVNEFMGTMGFFSASLGLNCTDCHISESSGDWGKYADDTALKRTSRMMIAMVNALNKSSFGGRRAVSCYSCHRGTVRPKVIPSLAEQYSAPPAEDPNEVEILPQ